MMEDEKKAADTQAEPENAISSPESEAELPAPEKEELLEAPKAEETDASQDAPETDSAKAAAIDEMEKATQKALDAMREQGNPENEEVVDEAEDHLKKIFDDFSAWLKDNTQPDRIKAEMKVVADSVGEVLDKTREKVIEVSQNEQFRSTMESGKDFVLGTAGLVGDGLKYGYDKLMEVPEFKKISDAISAKVDDLRHSEKLRSAVEQGGENISSFNSSLFKSILSFFDEPAKSASEAESKDSKDDLPDLPDLPNANK